MSGPRVLVSGVTLAQPMGGVRRHGQELLPRLAKLLEARGGSLAVLASSAGLPFELPRSIELVPSAVPARPALARAALESLVLRKHAERFDLVHTDHLPAPRGLALPFTLTLHDLKSVASAHEPLARRIVGRRVIQDAVTRAAAVLVVSRTLQSEVHERFGVAREKLQVVPNGCDHLPLLAREPATPLFVLFVGHLEPRKNIELVLRALALDPTLPELQIAGAPKSGHERRLRELARELGVADRVRFLGLQDDAELARLYATCGCVVSPSLREGFDIPVVEASRARAPLTVSRIAVHAELAPDAASFDPLDPTACARAIRAARAAAPVAHASWDDAARAWLDVILRVTARAAAGGP